MLKHISMIVLIDTSGDIIMFPCEAIKRPNGSWVCRGSHNLPWGPESETLDGAIEAVPSHWADIKPCEREDIAEQGAAAA